MNRQYRWLTVGQSYRYGPKVGKGGDTRRGTVYEVVTVPRPGVVANVLVHWPDGHGAVVPAGTLREVIQKHPHSRGGGEGRFGCTARQENDGSTPLSGCNGVSVRPHQRRLCGPSGNVSRPSSPAEAVLRVR